MSQSPASPRTIVLLDVDGVLNAIQRTPKGAATSHRAVDSTLSEFRVGEATIREDDGLYGAVDRTYRIVYTPQVASALTKLREDGLIDLRWLTTWAHDAPTSIAPLVGLPVDLPVVAEPPVRTSETHLNTQDVKVSFGPGGSKEWWKLVAVREVLVANPDAVVVWVDDDMQFDPAAVELVNTTDRLFAVVPESYLGLTSQDLDMITKIATAIAAAKKDAHLAIARHRRGRSPLGDLVGTYVISADIAADLEEKEEEAS